MKATHQVTRDVFDPATGQKRLSAGEQVKAIDFGDHFYIWQVPYDALAKPFSIEPWMASRSLSPIANGQIAQVGT